MRILRASIGIFAALFLCGAITLFATKVEKDSPARGGLCQELSSLESEKRRIETRIASADDLYQRIVVGSRSFPEEVTTVEEVQMLMKLWDEFDSKHREKLAPSRNEVSELSNKILAVKVALQEFDERYERYHARSNGIIAFLSIFGLVLLLIFLACSGRDRSSVGERPS